MQLKSWLELILRSCWWMVAFLVGCASLNEQDFQKVHCELWGESRKMAMHSRCPMGTIAKKPLLRMSTGKDSNEIVVNNIEVCIRELGLICSGINDSGEQD